MNTRFLMISSSVFMGLLGVVLSFTPKEVLEAFGQVPTDPLTLLMQLAGALYFGFAMTNWMAKTVLMGGIYARPLSMGNFFHFFIAGVALIKSSVNSNTISVYLSVLTIIYVVFAVLFGYVLFTNPAHKQTKSHISE